MRDLHALARRGVLDLIPYSPGRSIEELQAELGLQEFARLDTNENPLGASPLALRAIRAELKKTHLYPDGLGTGLVRALSRRLDMDPASILTGNGADGCITQVSSAFLNAGDQVVLADPTFPVYTEAVRIAGGIPVRVPLKNDIHDLESMAAAVGPRTRLVVVCNPNNPTGSIVEAQALDAFAAGLPDHVVMVLDEAYGEFIRKSGYPDSLKYIRAGRPVLGLRTFSKLYGLAGLRIGYLLGPEDLISVVRRVREVFPVSRPAQAGALAALNDEAFVRRTLRNNETGKRYLYREFRRLGLSWVPSSTNFVFVDLGRDSRSAHQALMRRGVLIRPGNVWNRPTWARITIGTMAQNRKLIEALTAVLLDSIEAAAAGRG